MLGGNALGLTMWRGWRVMPARESVLHELLGGSQLVAHHAEELLALLQHVEIDQRDLQLAVVVHLLQAVDVLLADDRQLVFQGVRLGQYLTIVLVMACLYHVASHGHQLVHLVTHGLELLYELLGQGVEVVFHVLQDGVEHTAQGVDELLVAVGAQVEPRVALYGDVGG